ncbi:hypothetical protein ABZ372_38845, partial [Streptomyces sp. NPDC005921]
MSFVIRYEVEISAPLEPGGPGLPLTVSNDVLAGSFVLDADITVTMTEGAATDTFEVTLINLPTDVIGMIRAVQARTALNVSIRLGYFDDPSTTTGDAGRVLVGRVTRISGTVGQDGYARTVLYGQEEGGYLLRNKPVAVGSPAGTSAQLFAFNLLEKAEVPVAAGSTLPGDLSGFTVRSGSTLDALRTLAERGNAPLVVRDGTVHLGAAVGAAQDTAPVALDPDTNIVWLDSS